jgi:spore coat protein U-like protein
MSNKQITLICSFALVGTLATSAPAFAVTECSFVNIVGVNFGLYDVFNSAPTDSIGSITYKCTDVGQSIITIDLDRGNSSTYNPRQMLQGSEALNYNLYLDGARTVIWGDGTSGTSRYGPLNPPDNVDVTLSIHGRLSARQNVRAGTYRDTIRITINF